jgi:hypothetical protein
MAPALAQAIRDSHDHLSRGLSWPDLGYDGAAAEAFIRQAGRQYAEDGVLSLGIWEDGRLMGGVGMQRVNLPSRSTHLGYRLVESA